MKDEKPIPENHRASPASYRKFHAAMHPITAWAHISCRESYQLSAERMDRKLTWRETVRWRFHTLMCSYCRPLPQQFTDLRTMLGELDGDTQSTDDKDIVKISPAAKSDIEWHLRELVARSKVDGGTT